MDYPDSPEGVALALLREILKREDTEERPDRRNRRTRDDMLDLFSVCLQAAMGKRSLDERVLQ